MRIGRTLRWLLCAAAALIFLVSAFLVHPIRHSLSELVGAELIGVTNSVAFIAITNHGGVPLTVYTVSQSSSSKGDWHAGASAQYSPVWAAGTLLASVGLSESTNGQRVRVLCSPIPGRAREAAFDFCLKYKLKALIPLFWPKTQEVAILPVELERFTAVHVAEFGGIGLGILDRNNQGQPLRTGSVYPGSPAERAGLQPNGFLISVDGTNVVNIPFAQSKDVVRGPVGSFVTLEIADSTNSRTNKFKIKRCKVVFSGGRQVQFTDQ